jgi:hypothetical protein
LLEITSRGDKSMPEPHVYSAEAREFYGDRAQTNYKFLDQLWEKDPNLRRGVVEAARSSKNDPKQSGFVQYLAENGLKLEFDTKDVSVLVVDCETAEIVKPEPIKAKFYILFLPANPRGGPGKGFKDTQQWAEAWYHAVRETGGM